MESFRRVLRELYRQRRVKIKVMENLKRVGEMRET